MKISKDELVELLDDVCSQIGELLVIHSQLSESLLDVRSTDQSKKIEKLKTKLAAEKCRMTKLRDIARKRRELEVSRAQRHRRVAASRKKVANADTE